MTREERLQQIAMDLFDISEEEKTNKKQRSELKEEFFRLLEYDFKGRDHILPVKTIEVPDSFWQSTKMTKDEFARSRFPGWNVEHVEKDITTGMTVFVLKRDPHYIPGIVEISNEYDDGDTTIKVSKEVAEYTPEVDWTTLQQERPDLFERLSKPVITLELDDNELEKIANEQPYELATLERHMIVREPALKVQPRRVKSGK